MLHQLVYEYLIKLSAFHDRLFVQTVTSIRMHAFTYFILLFFLVLISLQICYLFLILRLSVPNMNPQIKYIRSMLIVFVSLNLLPNG